MEKPRLRRAPLALLVAAIAASAPFALAQGRKPAAKPPKPPASASAAASAAPSPAPLKPDDAPAAATAAAVDAGARADTPVPPPVRNEGADGGPRPSPLNPQPNELPSQSAVDGGVATIDYDRLLADIAALRARVSAVGDTLFHSRMAISLQTDGDKTRISRLTVSVDDGVVYTNAQRGFRAEDGVGVYDRAVAPGRHAVTVDVERLDPKNEGFQTAQRSRFIIDVPKDNKVVVEVKIADDSTMGADFPEDKSGRYDLRVRAKAQARPLGK
ncbi:MAG: hypothetical protein JNL38_05745 [Myxococcales bacterium]|nr:hypothetical protein [Myxococcales bacterium]